MAFGLINFFKVPGPTSQAAVTAVRRILKEKVGHLGTLDPAAAGVLPLLVGRATRLAAYLPAEPKVYRFEVVFGTRTDTGDAQGRTLATASAAGLERSAVQAVLGQLTGQQQQEAPLASAVKVAGRPLYRYFREGRPVNRPFRAVEVHSLRLLEFAGGPEATALLEAVVSAGTYVRVLGEELGARVGLPSHVRFILRTAVGPFQLDAAIPLEDLRPLGGPGWVDPASALRELPGWTPESTVLADLRQGRIPAVPIPVAGSCRFLAPDGQLLGVGRVTEGRLESRVWLGDEARTSEPNQQRG